MTGPIKDVSLPSTPQHSQEKDIFVKSQASFFKVISIFSKRARDLDPLPLQEHGEARSCRGRPGLCSRDRDDPRGGAPEQGSVPHRDGALLAGRHPLFPGSQTPGTCTRNRWQLFFQVEGGGRE